VDITERIAVVTGGGSGMGRELVVQLAAAGASVAACDLHVDNLDDTITRARAGAAAGVKVTAHRCDVSDRDDMERFRDEVLAEHDTDHVNLLFNNAGIAGGGSFVTGDEAEWLRTFGVCWGGVYNGCRAFLPLLVKSDAGYLVNTSSVNGFWASLGPGIAHTAYSSAKFAVKGLSESLLEDLRINAPHVKVAVVMPGHIGTDILTNTRRVHVGDGRDDLGDARQMMERQGIDASAFSDDDIRNMMEQMGVMFRDNAPMTAGEAAAVILDGVRNDEWRILVGEDAKQLDAAVRADPLGAYGPEGLSLGSIIDAVGG
jgi:NAD(P)-dependent dehydrogenase (short-subunit alcohol dehydrogenase family)